MTPIPKTISSHQKGVKMKSTQAQPKKKIAMTKALNDSISDTISSVIQGKLAYQKAESKPTSPKKLVKNDKPKVIKKLSANTKKAVVASSSATCTPPKNDNANVTRGHNTKAEPQSSPKKQQEKPVKAATSTVKQLKPNVLSADVKSQIKPTNVVKRQNSPAKVVNTVTDKDKASTNVSKDTTKERVANKTDVPEKKHKQALLKKKLLAVNKAVKIKKKITANKNVKQKLVSKPKKVVQTAIKTGVVKKKILVAKSAALTKKIIRKITPKKTLPPKEDTTNSSKSTPSINTLINSNNSEKANTAAKSFLKEEQIKKEPLDDLNSTKLIKIKEEHDFDIDKKSPKTKALSKVKSKPNAMMVKRLLGNHSVKNAKQSKKMKLYNMWNGPKRHRVASLNALAKVHCLYENETRGVLLDQMIDSVKKENTGRIKSEDEAPPSTRQLRNNPGSRGVGKHWEMHESCSSSSSPTSEEEDEYEFKETNEKPYLRKIRRIREPSKIKDKIKIDTNDSSDDTEAIVAPIKAKRPRKTKKKSNSPIMDLKDLIVPKRMASLNASAILAASYSMDKRSNRPPNSDSEDSTDSSDSYFKEPIPEDEQLEQIVKMEQQQAVDERNKLIDVRATPNSKKVAVILNQDTDVTITGVYVNSTRSTHHEGFCSIAGMQYRISATSHTQTAATAVTSETILQNEHSTTNSTGDSTTSTTVPAHPNKSYTPLDALSSMKPPSTSTTSSNPATNNGNNPPPTGQPAPQATQPTTHVNNSQPPKQHHPHSHHHHHHRQQQQHLSTSPPAGGVGPLPHQQYHHHHHHVGGPPPPPPGHYHHPHQLVVAQYPHQYYPHQHSGPIKGRYGLYHHHGGGGHHHGPSASSVIDRAPSDSSAFSAPPGVSAFPVSSTSAGAVSTISSSASVVAASGIQPPLTVSQSSAGSGSESDGVGSGYVHGYYQPAGPLISLSHGHSQPAPLVKTQPVDPPTSISPLPGLHKIQPPSSTGDSSDNEVIITSVTTIKDNSSSTTPSSRLSPTVALTHPSSSLPPPPPSAYRSPYHTPQPYAPPPPSAYSSYPPPYGSPYHSSYYSPYPPPNHHELCYPAPGGGYVTTTAHHKYPPPQSAVQASLAYRRYLNTASAGGAYYVTAAPEMFSGQGPGPGPGPGGQGGGDARAVAGGGSSGASSNGSVSYQIASPHHQSTPQSGSSHSSQPGQGLQPPGQPPTIIETYTPPPALLDPYPPPPPSSHYYPGYGPAAPPPPSCYSHPHPHSPSRGVPFLNATYPPCPCPMQSCPKNVHTGPLTGDCKRSTALQIAKATTLPPVALALPLEPASATGPPSPARGSAGMAPPPSPAGAMYQTLPLASTMSDLLPQLKNEQISDSESNTTTHHQTSAASEHHEQPQRPPRDDVTTVDFKPTEEKRRKARVGKAMVRNSIQQMQQMNHVVNNGSNVSTMLLMCNPPASNQTVVDQTTLIGIDVKREVESPEEVQHQHQEVRMIEKEKGCACVEELIVPEDLTTTKVPSVLSNGQIQVNQTSLESFPIEDVKTEKMIEVSSVTEVVKTIEILEPCQKTVAENVKVKNMKRKLSLNNNNNNNNVEEKKLVEESPTPAKKSKQNSQISINNNIPNNGSYKDLIKKGCSTVKMNNGRRKLITTNGGKLQSKLVPSKFPKKRTPVKRKAIVPLKDETNSKRVKLNPKPVAINNSKDSNHPAVKNNEVKENIENIVKSKAKNGRKNVNQSETIKTNVDRTIESVVMNSCSVARTEKPPPTRSRSRSNDTSKEHKDNEPAVGINKRSATKIVPTPPLISVTHVLIPSAVPSVESFLKPRPSVVMFPPSRAAAAVASTSKAASVISVVTTPKVVVGVVPTTGKSDVCASKAGTSKQSVVRKRKGVALTVGSVAAGTRSLKASAAVASVAVVAAAAAAVVPRTGRRSLQHQQPRWSNGWTWEGVPFQREVFLNSDDAAVARKCYPAMRHREGDTIEPRDCVLLKAGPRKNDLPFVAKVAALWENPEDGEMMMSLLWYYRPEHTEQGRTCADQPDEVFASRHKDSNSVACIEDKCYVLTFNEYCRYRKNLKRLEDGLADTSPCIPLSEPYLRDCRQPPKSVPTSPEMIFFCRRVYDFRQKRIVKNPS